MLHPTLCQRSRLYELPVRVFAFWRRVLCETLNVERRQTSIHDTGTLQVASHTGPLVYTDRDTDDHDRDHRNLKDVILVIDV